MRTGDQMRFRRISALLLLAALLSVCLYAPAETAAEEDDRDVAMMLARNVAEAFGLQDASGAPLVPRAAEEMAGRGIPDEIGVEPDYRGVVGYMSLQADWEVSRFITFTETPWILPVYEPDGEDWKIAGQIQHKTPVLVVDQNIREAKGHKFIGYLRVIRLDLQEEAWIDVRQFVTVPYWTLELTEAVGYGFCVAVYSEQSRYQVLDRKGRRGPLPEGTSVLMCDRRSSRYISSDKEHNPLLGIIFRSKEESKSYFRTFLFFGVDDLTLVY